MGDLGIIVPCSLAHRVQFFMSWVVIGEKYFTIWCASNLVGIAVRISWSHNFLIEALIQMTANKFIILDKKGIFSQSAILCGTHFGSLSIYVERSMHHWLPLKHLLLLPLGVCACCRHCIITRSLKRPSQQINCGDVGMKKGIGQNNPHSSD